jgi:hypothetical protein
VVRSLQSDCGVRFVPIVMVCSCAIARAATAWADCASGGGEMRLVVTGRCGGWVGGWGGG